MVDQTAFYLLAIPAVMLAGISKGGFGGAVGGIAVPLLALTVPTTQAASIMLPLLCLSDLFGFRVYFGKWDRANVKVLLRGAVVGIALGAVTFGLMTERAIRFIVGAIAVVFTLYRWLGSRTPQGPATPSVARGTFWGGLSGYTSFVAHAGGPPAMIYLLPQQLDKTTYVATGNLFFMLVNLTKVIPYFLLGQLSRQNLLTSLVLAPLVPAGVWLGLWLHRRINQSRFYLVIQICLLVTGLQLIYQALTSR
jgi:uncharacterized protein